LCHVFQVGGPFGGYATEREFYRAMFRTHRNNPLTLILAGILAIPIISAVTGMMSG
jgi:hypothetical protein